MPQGKSRPVTRLFLGRKNAIPNFSSTLTRCEKGLDSGSDFGEHYTLVSNDPEEVRKEIEKLRAENSKLREEISSIEPAVPRGGSGSGSEQDMARLNVDAKAPVPVEEVPGVVSRGVPAGAAALPLQEELRSAELDRQGHEGPTEEAAQNVMDIVFVTSEVAPWSKTGGLADVAGSLPVALSKRGHRVMVVAPRYLNGVTDARYSEAEDTGSRVTFNLGVCGDQTVGYFHQHTNGVDFVFVDHPCFHRSGNPYGDEAGTFGDNQFRFCLLSLAACEAPLNLHIGGYKHGSPPGFPYGDKCVFVANDWHAGMVCCYVAARYRPYGVYNDARTVLAIHNLMHQGVEPATTYGQLGMPSDWYGALEWVFPEHMRAHELDKGEAVNIMKGAMVTADRIMTVSQGYAWEITTPEGGFLLDGLLRTRQHQLNGVANGIDMVEWNPATDSHIPANYSVDDMSGKRTCKEELQRELGLNVNPDIPLVGFIGRLDSQKGPDLFLDAVWGLRHRDVQMVMLGSGVPALEGRMREMEREFPDHFRGWVGFSIPVAHRIIAGADIIIMPSRFEPCGLNQLYAMAYGTIPVAHATGGLRDTIEDFNPFAKGKLGAGTGWTYSPNTVEALLSACDNALTTYRSHHESWTALQVRAMSQDLSWNRAAKQWEQVFTWAKIDPAYCG
eukprot:CAMPEP_0177599634 /NCGR_PEP_ID=MMETSP0419_2-20121207/13107_1 /TAXON_ID=582737 /ORGANISM="Tetraselmis sp., Strain GSL018" /LENGTH=669 /DNA_ID=CAMNT_0019092399 /DNA_START=189 /DNA_END=2198 /DNA_ORIENTATION=-